MNFMRMPRFTDLVVAIGCASAAQAADFLPQTGETIVCVGDSLSPDNPGAEVGQTAARRAEAHVPL